MRAGLSLLGLNGSFGCEFRSEWRGKLCAACPAKATFHSTPRYLNLSQQPTVFPKRELCTSGPWTYQRTNKMRQKGLYEFWPTIRRPGQHAAFRDTKGIQRGLYEFWPSIPTPRVSIMSLTVDVRQQIYLDAGILNEEYIWIGPKISYFDSWPDDFAYYEAQSMSLSLLLTSRQVGAEVQSLLWSNNLVVCRAIYPGDLLPLWQSPRLISNLRRLIIYYSGPKEFDEPSLCQCALGYEPPWNLPRCHKHGVFQATVTTKEFSETLRNILKYKAPHKLELGLLLDVDDDYGDRD